MNCMKTEKWAVFFDVLLLMALRLVEFVDHNQ